MSCELCIAQRIALGWLFRNAPIQRFDISGASKMEPLDALHAIARRNARHANN